MNNPLLQMEASPVNDVKVRSEGGKSILYGYAAVYDSPSVVMDEGNGPFREIVLPGAFDACLAGDYDVVALRNHDINQPLGRLSAGTLRLWSDEVGLAFEVDLSSASYAQDLAENVDRRDIVGCSFKGSVYPGGMTIDRSGPVALQVLREVILTEVTCGCTFAAYPGSSIMVRSHLTVIDPPPPAPVPTPVLNAARRTLEVLRLRGPV